MPSKLPRIPLYLNETLKMKFEYIAFKNGRSVNSEARHLFSRYIAQYEKRNGEIRFDYYCDLLHRPVVVENGSCFLKGKCKCDNCQQRGGSKNYLGKI